MLELVLLRHPETQWNRDKLLQGQSDIPALDPTVPESLVDAIYSLGVVAGVHSSDLLRAAAPADDLYRKLRVYCNEPLFILQNEMYRERHFGDLEGQPYHALGCADLGTVGEILYRRKEVPHGESLEYVQDRASAVADYVLQYDNSVHCVLPIMTHTLFMNYLINALERRSPQDLSMYRVVPNLCGFHLQIEERNVLQINPFPGR